MDSDKEHSIQQASNDVYIGLLTLYARQLAFFWWDQVHSSYRKQQKRPRWPWSGQTRTTFSMLERCQAEHDSAFTCLDDELRVR
jgi:hypothetical protein